MKVIVSGATGFIGQHLIPLLLHQDNEVIVVSRNAEEAYRIFPAGVKVIGWDPKELRESVSVAGAVINLAGESIAGSKWTRSKKASILNSRLIAAQRMKHAIRSAHNEKLVYVQASAIGYYGDAGDKFCHEHDGPGNGFLAHVCQKWESYVPMIKQEAERTLIIRIGVVLGKEGGFLPEMIRLSKKHLAGKLGDGRQWMSWIHICDLVYAIIYLLSDPKANGTFNLVSTNPIMQKDFAGILASKTRRKLQLPAPAFLIKSLFGSMGNELLLSGQRVSASNLKRQGFMFKYDQIEEALDDIMA